MTICGTGILLAMYSLEGRTTILHDHLHGRTPVGRVSEIRSLRGCRKTAEVVVQASLPALEGCQKPHFAGWKPAPKLEPLKKSL